MEGLTVAEIAAKLRLLPDTVKKRLKRAGVAPIAHAGPTSIYPRSAVEAIRNAPSPGRPRKAKD